MTKDKIIIRECESIESLEECTRLQREVFALPELEVSPVRHLVVTKHAGGFTLGAFDGEKLVGFVLSVPGFDGGERFFYSHMAAVSADYQSLGIGATIKMGAARTSFERKRQTHQMDISTDSSEKCFF